MARTRALPMCLTLPDLPQIPRPLTTRIENTTFCLVPSIAASQARLSSSSYALDFAIVGALHAHFLYLSDQPASPLQSSGNYNSNPSPSLALSTWSPQHTHIRLFSGRVRMVKPEKDPFLSIRSAF